MMGIYSHTREQNFKRERRVELGAGEGEGGT